MSAPRRTRSRGISAGALPWAGLCLLTAGCGGNDAGFTLRIVTDDVARTAVDEVQILLTPGTGEMFDQVPDRAFANGEIFTHTASDGRFLIRVERAWLLSHAEDRDPGFEFALELLAPDGSTATPTRAPQLRVTFKRGVDEIAQAERPLEWPLRSGGELTVDVRCGAGFTLQCTGGAPAPSTDAGVD